MGIVKTRTGPEFILRVLPRASHLSTYIQRNNARLLKNIRAVFINSYLILCGKTIKFYAGCLVLSIGDTDGNEKESRNE